MEVPGPNMDPLFQRAHWTERRPNPENLCVEGPFNAYALV